MYTNHYVFQVPQLPKPKNVSPKPTRAVQQPASVTANNNTTVTTTENKSNTDLLGLQNGDDSFSGFLSAPLTTNAAKEEKKKDEPDPIKSEEESFFNQTAPPEKEKVKLTKDSILALYGSAPPVNTFNQFQNQPPQIPFQQGFQPQQGFQNFSGYSQVSKLCCLKQNMLKQNILLLKKISNFFIPAFICHPKWVIAVSQPNATVS